MPGGGLKLNPTWFMMAINLNPKPVKALWL
jgi:hypothetical protein